jgi:hypothetical protein
MKGSPSRSPGGGASSHVPIKVDRSILPLGVVAGKKRPLSGGEAGELPSSTGTKNGWTWEEGRDLEASPPENADLLLVLLPSSLNIAVCVNPISGKAVILLAVAAILGGSISRAVGQSVIVAMPRFALTFLAGCALSICLRDRQKLAARMGSAHLSGLIAIIAVIPLSWDCVRVAILLSLWLLGIAPLGRSAERVALGLAIMGSSIPLYVGSMVGSVVRLSAPTAASDYHGADSTHVNDQAAVQAAKAAELSPSTSAASRTGFIAPPRSGSGLDHHMQPIGDWNEGLARRRKVL